ncbi:MAG: EfeM/EfeO family lipoprotein [Anaerolineae bacterium]|nr:EfeM/EfeO family lipoprotein [Anaerolineae bacterium]
MQFLRGVLAVIVLLGVVALAVPVKAQAEAELGAIKTYLLEKAAALVEGSAILKADLDSYYELAKSVNFDYDALWSQHKEDVVALVEKSKSDWMNASPLYEQMEGIVAGVPSLANYDVIMDAGGQGETNYAITLPDGTVLQNPPNLFGLLELTLWGGDVDKKYVAKSVDLDGDGAQEFGEELPDANAAKGFADSLDFYANGLQTDATAWEPTTSDAFTALVVMIPTMSEYFESWKLSRFVAGNESEQGEFSVISRLSDIKDIIGSLEVIYTGISPLVASVDSARDEQINSGLTSLKEYVLDLYQQEQDGKRFTAEEADLFGSEAQDKAEAIAGQVAQVAALLNVPIAQ